MSPVKLVKNTFKYLLYLLMLLLVLLVFSVAFVLYTEAGSRWALELGISSAEIDVTYDKLTGNLSDGLTIDNFKYKDQVIEIKIEKISYQSDWSWFSRHLELSEVHLDQVTVNSQTSTEPVTQNQTFSGIQLPLSIDIKDMLIKQLTLSSDSVSDSSKTEIKQLTLSALVDTQSADINQLTVKAAAYQLSTEGSLNYSGGLAYQLDTEWQLDSEGQSVQGRGFINGDLMSLMLQHDFNLTGDQLTGTFQLIGEITELQQKPQFDVKLSSEKADLLIQQQTLQFNHLLVLFTGEAAGYEITAASDLSPNKIDQIELPASQLTFKATGNSQELTTQSGRITTPEGLVELQAQLNWQQPFKLSSQLSFTDLNPGQFLQGWPGMINGQMQFNLSLSEQGMVIKTNNNALQGQLKGQPFELSGAANYAADTLTAEQVKLQLGDNQVLINGQINQQAVALEGTVNWTDLSLIDTHLSGSLMGSVGLSGDYQNPQLKLDLVAQQLTFIDHQIAQLNMESQGVWNERLVTSIKAKNVLLANQSFESVQIKQLGWLDNHEVDVSVESVDFNSSFGLTGQYEVNQTSQRGFKWQGQLSNHELTVDGDKSIQLKAPILIQIADQIIIEQGCWQGVEAGTLCVKLNDIDQAKGRYQGALSLDAFSLIPLQVLLPENFEVKGKLQGAAEFLYQAEDLTVEANLKLEAGELLVRNNQEVVYQSAIEVFEVDAKTNNQLIELFINTRLADQSYLRFDTKLDKPGSEQWQINSSIQGEFLSTELITGLTAEINELEGKISIQGIITGPLSAPNIEVKLSQPKGYLALTRLGTVIEQLQLSINTEPVKDPIYNIKFSGKNIAAINEGQIESTGNLSFSAAQQWQYQGQISGSNFMLLNLPEAQFKVSPKLKIVANQQATDISGDLTIDSGYVVIKQLPASSVNNSDDLEVHQPDAVNSTVYPVTMNVQAKIKQPIQLDVIGLEAGLTGSIQLVKSQGKTAEGNGILSLTDGSYEVYGQNLDIEQGELTFTGPLENPRLNVRASRTSISGDVVAGVQLGGTVNNLRSELFSEPNLADIEKLSYIMTGRGSDNSGTLDGNQLKQAAIVMGLNQSSPIFNQIQDQFGIDVLTVRESAVAADTVIEAGKKINDKLYVSYNQGLFSRLGFWMLKYRINEFLNLQTTQGEDQSIELVYTRKARPPETSEVDARHSDKDMDKDTDKE